jgi:hypothetical protein
MNKFKVYFLMMSFLVLSTTLVRAEVNTRTTTKATAAPVASPVVQAVTKTSGMPTRPGIPATPTFGANKMRTGANTQQQEMLIEIAAARVVIVPNNNSYTHRWEVDVRNKTYSPIAEQIRAEGSQCKGAQNVAIAGASSIMGIGPNEVKTISGGFKAADGVDNIKIYVRFFNLAVGERTVNMPIDLSKLDMAKKPVMGMNKSSAPQTAQSQANTAIPSMNAVKVEGIMPPQFNVTSLVAFAMSENSYLWQAKVRNIKAQVINDVKVMASVMNNGSWVPAGNEVDVAHFAANAENSYNGNFSGTGVAKVKLDIFIKKDGAYQLNASKTINFDPAQVMNMAQNLIVHDVTVAPLQNGRLRWTAQVTNNNPVAINNQLIAEGDLLSGGHWRSAGSTICYPLAPGETKTCSSAFWHDINSESLKVSVAIGSGADRTVVESPLVAVAPVTVNVAVNNASIVRSGTIANWSASIASSSSDTLYDVKVKTYHRASNGAWAQASNDQTRASLAPGAPFNINGMFTPGSSNQFKIEVVYHYGSEGMANSDTSAVATTWEGGF